MAEALYEGASVTTCGLNEAGEASEQLTNVLALRLIGESDKSPSNSVVLSMMINSRQKEKVYRR